jgi:hypothetical protein
MDFKHQCPHCKKVQEAYAAADGSNISPVDGDMSICFDCGEWSIFQNKQLRLPDEKERKHIDNDFQCRRIVDTWKKLMQEKQRGTSL